MAKSLGLDKWKALPNSGKGDCAPESIVQATRLWKVHGGQPGSVSEVRRGLAETVTPENLEKKLRQLKDYAIGPAAWEINERADTVLGSLRAKTMSPADALFLTRDIFMTSDYWFSTDDVNKVARIFKFRGL